MSMTDSPTWNCDNYECAKIEQCDSCWLIDHLKECNGCTFYDHPKALVEQISKEI